MNEKRLFWAANSIFLAIFLFVFPAKADYVIGHNKPLPEEILKKPIKLTKLCKHVVISEWRGSEITDERIRKLDSVCNRAVDNFELFITSNYIIENVRDISKLSVGRKYKIKANGEFNIGGIFGFSLLPDSKEYRGLNDVYFRFDSRISKDVWGYTSKTSSWVWFTADFVDSPIEMIFAHELFHAMSNYYGIMYQHLGSDWEQKFREEALAEKFTDYLGYYNN